jgi:hypothetical protein
MESTGIGYKPPRARRWAWHLGRKAGTTEGYGNGIMGSKETTEVAGMDSAGKPTGGAGWAWYWDCAGNHRGKAALGMALGMGGQPSGTTGSSAGSHWRHGAGHGTGDSAGNHRRQSALGMALGIANHRGHGAGHWRLGTTEGKALGMALG